MRKILKQQFIKNSDNLYIIHDKFTFWDFLKVLRKYDYEVEGALNFIFANCSLSALVFQECIINKKFKQL